MLTGCCSWLQPLVSSAVPDSLCVPPVLSDLRLYRHVSAAVTYGARSPAPRSLKYERNFSLINNDSRCHSSDLTYDAEPATAADNDDDDATVSSSHRVMMSVLTNNP